MSGVSGDVIRRVGIIGYGYVGRGTGHAFASVAEIEWHDPAVGSTLPLSDLVHWAHALFICVPTPMAASGAAELGVVREVVSQLAELHVHVPVVLKSSIPPGTTEALGQRWPSVPLVFNPEFFRERHYLEDAASPSRVILGWSAAIDCRQRARVRALFTRRFPRSPIVELTSVEAELVKYAANALFGVKVSFANEMADLAESLGVNWEPVREALVLDPRVGDGHLMVPGPDGERGFGGKCLPKDMAALLTVAADHGVELDVVAAAVRGNHRRRRTS